MLFEMMAKFATDRKMSIALLAARHNVPKSTARCRCISPTRGIARKSLLTIFVSHTHPRICLQQTRIICISFIKSILLCFFVGFIYSGFYECSNGVAYHLVCPAGLYFNPHLNVCDYPDQVSCGSK